MTSISRSPMAGIRREMTLSSPMVADRSPKRKLLGPMDASTPLKMLRTNKIGPPASNLDTRAQYLRFNTLEAHADCAALAPPDSDAPASTMADEKACSTSGDPRRDELEEEAATKVQKLFKGHRTRRSLADCAIVVEELWWKLCDSASLDRKSVSFFRPEEERETAASRWVRAGKRVARVGKGLSKDDKAQKLALRHWLEAIDPRHRYGHNLHLYYDIWFHSSSTEPFFYWLDIGAGRDIYHPNCPRSKLHSQLVMYLGMNERAAYEVAVQDGRLIYKQRGVLVNTTEDSKWIFVLSTTRSLYVGQKKKGEFQHSSFLAGGATSAAGRLVAKQGVLQAIWPYSGHYLPTEENFNEFITFLQENHVDLTNVKRCSVDDDVYPLLDKATASSSQEAEVEMPAEVPKRSLKWASGAGARIGCVREYPAELQSKALEQVNLSPKVASPASRQMMPIPSPRPSPRVRLSPRVQYMGMGMGMMPSPSVRPPKKQCLGIQAPTVHLTLPKHKAK